MSIFRKQPIKAGDLVIGVNKYSLDNKGAAVVNRYFTEPSLILEIKGDSALVFFEQDGPIWYNLTKLERCYVKEEFAENNKSYDRRELARDRVDNSDQSGDKAN